MFLAAFFEPIATHLSLSLSPPDGFTRSSLPSLSWLLPAILECPALIPIFTGILFCCYGPSEFNHQIANCINKSCSIPPNELPLLKLFHYVTVVINVLASSMNIFAHTTHPHFKALRTLTGVFYFSGSPLLTLQVGRAVVIYSVWGH